MLADRDIERFLEALPGPIDRFERFFRLAEAIRFALIRDVRELSAAPSDLSEERLAVIDEMIARLKEAVSTLFADSERIDGMADRLASTRPPDLTLEDGVRDGGMDVGCAARRVPPADRHNCGEPEAIPRGPVPSVGNLPAPDRRRAQRRHHGSFCQTSRVRTREEARPGAPRCIVTVPLREADQPATA